MNFLLPIVFAAGIFYLFVHLGLSIGLWRNRGTRSAPRPFVSVIVAARNEERTLPPLLEQLSRQTYTEYEVVIVNDRSTDGTQNAIDACIARDSRFRSIMVRGIPDGMPAKKNALRAGIAASRGEILCFTDADCLPTEEWISTLSAAFDETTGMVAGFSPYRSVPSAVSSGKSGWVLRLLWRFVAYEEFRGGIWSAGSIGWNNAWLCTGRNLAYRRQVYDELGGFEPIKMSVSGDDDLFMQAVRRKTKWKIRYCFDPQNAVVTDPPPSFRSFVNQRRRHFSAGKYFSAPMKLFFAAYHGSNLILSIASITAIVLLGSPAGLLAALAFKLAADTALVLAGAEALHVRGLAAQFLPMEFLYVLYNSLIGPLGFTGSFTWKAE